MLTSVWIPYSKLFAQPRVYRRYNLLTHYRKQTTFRLDFEEVFLFFAILTLYYS